MEQGRSASRDGTLGGKESSDSEPAMSEVSDQYSMLEHAYQSVRNVFSTTSEGKLVGGDGSLNQLESLPGHWPLAKLTLPLKFGVNRLDGLLVGYLMELRATHSDPSKCRRQISSFAKTLTVRVATYLAEIAGQKASTSARCRWVLSKRTPFTCTASLPEPDTCGCR